jgi:hypothetical protein
MRPAVVALIALIACTPTVGRHRAPAPEPIAASASELPPEVADAVLCFQGGNLMEESARDHHAEISPTDLGRLRRGYDAAIHVVRRYYGPSFGPVAESDARIVLEEFQKGFVDPAAAPDVMRAYASNYLQWNKVFAACQRVR